MSGWIVENTCTYSTMFKKFVTVRQDKNKWSPFGNVKEVGGGGLIYTHSTLCIFDEGLMAKKKIY